MHPTDSLCERSCSVECPALAGHPFYKAAGQLKPQLGIGQDRGSREAPQPLASIAVIPLGASVAGAASTALQVVAHNLDHFTELVSLHTVVLAH